MEVNRELTAFGWWKPDPTGPLPTWTDSELLENVADLWLFSSVRQETRFLIWDAPPLVSRTVYNPLDEAPELWRQFVELQEGDDVPPS